MVLCCVAFLCYGKSSCNEGALVFANNHIEHVHDWAVGHLLQFCCKQHIDYSVVKRCSVEGEDIKRTACSSIGLLFVSNCRLSYLVGYFARRLARPQIYVGFCLESRNKLAVKRLALGSFENTVILVLQ